MSQDTLAESCCGGQWFRRPTPTQIAALQPPSCNSSLLCPPPASLTSLHYTGLLPGVARRAPAALLSHLPGPPCVRPELILYLHTRWARLNLTTVSLGRGVYLPLLQMSKPRLWEKWSDMLGPWQIRTRIQVWNLAQRTESLEEPELWVWTCIPAPSPPTSSGSASQPLQALLHCLWSRMDDPRPHHHGVLLPCGPVCIKARAQDGEGHEAFVWQTPVPVSPSHSSFWCPHRQRWSKQVTLTGRILNPRWHFTQRIIYPLG